MGNYCLVPWLWVSEGYIGDANETAPKKYIPKPAKPAKAKSEFWPYRLYYRKYGSSKRWAWCIYVYDLYYSGHHRWVKGGFETKEEAETHVRLLLQNSNSVVQLGIEGG